MKYKLLIVFILAANIYYAQDTFKSVHGNIRIYNSDEFLVFAMVEIRSNDFSLRTVSDIDGNFQFDYLPNGSYTITIRDESNARHYDQSIQIDTLSSDTLYRDFTFRMMPIRIDYGPIYSIRIPYRHPQNPTLSYKEIQKSVNKYQLPALVQGISSNAFGNSSELSLNGARQGDYLFLIDGVKCREMHQVPSASMKSVTVMSHFIPANYGDTTGGVISMETMSYMDLYYVRESQGSGQ